MPKQDALSIFLDDASKDKLMESYAELTAMIQKAALSIELKNTNITGDVVKGGSVVARRLGTAVSQTYGTARAAGAGDKLTNLGVEVNINIDKEIVEELEQKDIERYGIPDLIGKRKQNQAMAVVRELDRAFFVAAENAVAANSGIVNVSAGATIAAKVELLIQALETVSNENVDGVDRESMVLTLSPEWYGALETYIDTLPNPNGGGVDVEMFHRVRVKSNIRQNFDAIIQVVGAIAQPAAIQPFQVEKINLSDATAVELFYSYGTKAVMPDLIKAAALDEDISV